MSSTNYKYQFYLDSETKTPDLESFSAVTKLSETLRIYEFNYPAVAGGTLIQNHIEDIQNNCQNYKLILVGEIPGDMEIYSSENYSGDLNVVIAGRKLWNE